MMRNEIIEAHYRKNYKHLVNRMVGRVTNNSYHIAEEVVQEAYFLAMKHWKAFNPERGEFGPWFNRILNNAANRSLREEQGTNLSLDNEDMDLEPFLLDSEVDIPKDVVLLVQKAIREQPDDKSEVLHMFFNLGMRTREIEECTGYGHSNIRQIIRRFRIKWSDENIF